MRICRALIRSFGMLLLWSVLPWNSEAASFGDAFWAHWGDGQAELAAYDLIYPRYGEQRPGLAVAIFVTETFSQDLRVKADPGQHPKEDEVLVMKLNLIQDFPTGVYDYNLMTSAFAVLEDTPQLSWGDPIKVSFSAQEWCGHRWSQSLWDHRAVRISDHSYFDGEADQELVLDRPFDESVGVEAGSADLLFLWARGVAGPFIEEGRSLELEMMMPLQDLALGHRSPRFVPVVLSRAVEKEIIEVPAGSFNCVLHTAEFEVSSTAADAWSNQGVWKFWVEQSFPHRLVRWEKPSGERGDLVGSKRMAYWELNAASGIQALDELGLAPRASRTP